MVDSLKALVGEVPYSEFVMRRNSLPGRIGLQGFNVVARHGRNTDSIGANPIHQLATVRPGVTTPARVRVLQNSVLEPERFENAGQRARKTGLFRAIGGEFSIGKMLMDLLTMIGIYGVEAGLEECGRFSVPFG